MHNIGPLNLNKEKDCTMPFTYSKKTVKKKNGDRRTADIRASVVLVMIYSKISFSNMN